MKSLGTTFRRALPWVCVCLSSSLPVRAIDISSVGVYSIINDKTTLSTDVSAFIAGYLSNQSSYRAQNLDLYVLTSLAAARKRTDELRKNYGGKFDLQRILDHLNRGKKKPKKK